MKRKINIYCWASDYTVNHGEGYLARKFVKLLSVNLNFKPVIISPTYNPKNINFSFFYKYFSPILGIIILWFYFLRGKKVCYLNFLPLWNTFLFLLLPPSTILGPITGFIYKKKIKSFESFLRKKIIPILFYFNYIFLKIRLKKILFSTSNLKEIFSNHKSHLYNFCLFGFKQKNSRKKNIDFLIYHREYSTKENNFIINIIKKLIKKNLKIEIVGHKIHLNNKNLINNGVLSRNSLLKKLSKTKYTILSGENMISFFSLDSLTENVRIFYNKNNIFLKNENLEKFYIPLNYENYSKSYKLIEKELKKRKKIKSKVIFKNLDDFNIYFEQFVYD